MLQFGYALSVSLIITYQTTAKVCSDLHDRIIKRNHIHSSLFPFFAYTSNRRVLAAVSVGGNNTLLFRLPEIEPRSR